MRSRDWSSDACSSDLCHAKGSGRMTAVDQRDAWTKQNIGYSSRMPRHFPTEYLLRSLCSRSYFALGKEIVPGQKVLDLGCLYLNNQIGRASCRERVCQYV